MYKARIKPRLGNKNKTSTTSVMILQCADDIQVSARASENLQTLIDTFTEAKSMGPTLRSNSWSISGSVSNSSYMGSRLSQKADTYDLIQRRLSQKADTHNGIQLRLSQKADTHDGIQRHSP